MVMTANGIVDRAELINVHHRRQPIIVEPSSSHQCAEQSKAGWGYPARIIKRKVLEPSHQEGRRFPATGQRLRHRHQVA